MKSIREIYKIGKGPSSSHTMGPQKAATIFRSHYPNASSYKAVLYGSLAETGKGHQTDAAVIGAFKPVPCEIEFCVDRTIVLPHDNTLDLIAYNKNGDEEGKMRVMSVGGGNIVIEGYPEYDLPDVYEESTFEAIAEKCLSHNIRLSDYVFEHEGEDIRLFLHKV